jgi:hypothetical protein
MISDDMAVFGSLQHCIGSRKMPYWSRLEFWRLTNEEVITSSGKFSWHINQFEYQVHLSWRLKPLHLRLAGRLETHIRLFHDQGNHNKETDMFKRRFLLGVSITLVTGLVLLSLVIFSARAAPPATNDDFDAATVIPSLPFHDSIDTSQATNSGEDPQPCWYAQRYATVWYSFTPSANEGITTDTSGSDYNVSVDVFTGSRYSLNPVASSCTSGNVAFQASAGVTYFFMVSAYTSGYPGPVVNGGTLVFNVSEIPGPANDNFADAVMIEALPFNQSVNTQFATMEANEPTPSCAGAGNTIWYSFTPATSSSYSADVSGGSNYGVIAVYRGASLGNLEEIGCIQRYAYWGSPLTLRLEAGTTYYFQAYLADYVWDWTINFSLYVTPPPNVDFYYWPSDPNTFEVVQFNNNSYDPGGVSFAATSWNFGDGATSADWSPTHQYRQDGDYIVRLDQTTTDGRTGTISKQVQVRTHDVVITRFTVPQSANSGQTRSISVDINNQRYPETVEVILYKSTPTGYVQVGSLTQFVPVRPSNRTTNFAFSYTFTNDDAAMGKVTFRAVANLVGARDALPANNEAIALPTKVGK